MEWSGGSETMEEGLARIHQREEAAVKRERAMAYAFSHQVCELAEISFSYPGFNQFERTQGKKILTTIISDSGEPIQVRIG